MKTYELPRLKAAYPCTYNQLKFMKSFESFNIEGSTSDSQMLKRLAFDVASEIIDRLKDGENVTLKVS